MTDTVAQTEPLPLPPDLREVALRAIAGVDWELRGARADKIVGAVLSAVLPVHAERVLAVDLEIRNNASRSLMDECLRLRDERDRLAAAAERMRPVVEAAKALREAQRRDVIDRPTTPHDLFVRVAELRPIREAFEAAVDTYEEQERGTGE